MKLRQISIKNFRCLKDVSAYRHNHWGGRDCHGASSIESGQQSAMQRMT